MKIDREIIKMFRDAGWVEVRNKTHPRLRCPAGCCVVSIPGTTGDVRTRRNLRARIKRCPGMRSNYGKAA